MARPRRADQVQELGEYRVDVFDIARVRAARASLPGVTKTRRLADLFAVLADPNRVRLVAALEHGELCVSDLAATVGLSNSATSHQLRLLRSLGLVRARRAGRSVYYALDDEHVSTLYRQALDHVGHDDRSEAGP